MAGARQVTVIGGGSSGMVAAISAARAGAEVILLERMNRVGKKLLATGNGRCNLTNANCDLSRFHGGDRAVVAAVLAQFPVRETLVFFERLGIAWKTEEDGKIYPYADQASAVLDVLRYELEHLHVAIQVEADVAAIRPFLGQVGQVGRVGPKAEGFVLALQDRREVRALRVVLASGGRAGPQFGSNGSGYRLAQSLGHRVIEPLPGIVSLRLDAPFLPRLKGVKFVGSIEARSGSDVLRREAGEILFTEYGISGPPVLQVSRMALAAMKETKTTTVVALDLFPELDLEHLDATLMDRLAQQAHKPLDLGLVGLLNKRLIPVVLAQAGIHDASQPCAGVAAKERRQLSALLKDWSFNVTGSQSWHDAQVAAGGVPLDEVNPETLESRRQPGLYLCGEVLDVDGDCGGFNLQWAWSSGWVAGRAAAGR
jgi:predicted Rossmann fold flavoprotein